MNIKASEKSTVALAVIVIALIAGLGGFFYYNERHSSSSTEYTITRAPSAESSYAETATQCVFHPNVPCPGTITQTIGSAWGTAQSITLPQGPYVLVRYHDLAAVQYYSAFNTEAQPGDLFLPIYMTIENHGYDSVLVSPGNFCVVIGKQQYQVSSVTFQAHGWLQTANVLNNQALSGYLVYELPANYTSGWSLVWGHPSNTTVILVHT
jgi:hypothetical protein